MGTINPSKGSGIRDAKTLNLSLDIVSLKILGRCIAFFTLRDQLVLQQKHLLRVERSCCIKESAGLLCATNFGFVARFSSNSKLVAQQICLCPTNQPISAPHFFDPQQMFLLRVKLIKQVKNAKHRPKLATKQCCATSLGFLYLVFHRL